MNTRAFRMLAVALATAAGTTDRSFAACDVRSAEKTVALVELYTSEGCSSCPPADRQLSRLRESLGPSAGAVLLGLHVGYWDYIGWKDPYAQQAFADRQSWLVRANGQRTVYTPQFFVGGADLRSRRTTLPDEVRRVNAVPAAAVIRLRAALAGGGALALDAEAKAPAGAEPAALYVAVTESGLASKVTRGENRGATLAHDHVVRAWIGPVPLKGGSAQLNREIELPTAWNRARLEFAAFVQDQRYGKVLQALGARQCLG